MRYSGVGFSPDFKNGRTSGTIEVGVRQVTFRSHDGNEFSFAMQGLKIDWGGTSNRQIFFNHDEKPDLGIACPEKKVLRDDSLQRHPFVALQSDSIRRRRLIGQSLALLLILVLIALPLTAFMFKSEIVAGIVNPLPSEKIVEYTRPLADAYLKEANLVKDPELKQLLDDMTADLRTEVKGEGFDFRFYVVKEDSFNAMAFPDGTVVIHTGLFDKTKTDGQVLGVLAHELSHVTQRHQVRSLAERAGIMIVAMAIMGDINSLFDVVVGGGAQLYLLKNSRDFEREADEVGFALMEKAEMNPQGMVETFEIMGKEGAALDEKVEELGLAKEDLDFFSTHPSSESRVKYLKEMLAEVKGKYPAPKDEFLKKIKERLKAIQAK